MTTGVLPKPKIITPAARQGAAADARAAPEQGTAPAPPPIVWPWQRRVREQDLVSLCHHLGALAGSGISLAECLRTYAGQAPQGALRKVLEEILHDIEAGRKLSDALGRHPDQFSAHFRAAVWAGETSGKMADTFDRLAVYLENKQDVKQRVRSAFAYPIVLSVVLVGVVTFLMLYVVPVFANVYTRMGVKLPLATQMLIDFSHVLVTQPWAPAAPAALIIGLAVWTRRSPAGRLWADRWKVRLPVVGPLLRQMVLYRFMRSFGEMMGAGVPVLDALDLAGRVSGNTAFGAAMEPVRQDVQRGLGLTEPLRRTQWFPPLLLQVIASGEQSGRVPALLARASEILQRDIDMTMKRVVGRIEPILTVLMAIIVGFVLLAVYLPMFDVMQHVGK